MQAPRQVSALAAAAVAIDSYFFVCQCGERLKPARSPAATSLWEYGVIGSNRAALTARLSAAEDTPTALATNSPARASQAPPHQKQSCSPPKIMADEQNTADQIAMLCSICGCAPQQAAQLVRMPVCLSQTLPLYVLSAPQNKSPRLAAGQRRWRHHPCRQRLLRRWPAG